MKAYLMFRSGDFNAEGELPWNEVALTQDLELNTLFQAMAQDDKVLADVTKHALFFSLTDVDTILYRQEILKDCLQQAPLIREIYDIVVETIEEERKNYWGFSSRYPNGILYSSLQTLLICVARLKKLKHIAEHRVDGFKSEGFLRFFAMLREELADDYFKTIQDHLRQLKFRGGILISAELGTGNKGVNYVLRRPKSRRPNWVARVLHQAPAQYTYYLHPRDERGARALSELRDRGVNLVANALAQSTDHILSFFRVLRAELAFYVGCLNLHEQMAGKGQPVCFPVPAESAESRMTFAGLYDICLALSIKSEVVGNELHADNKSLVMITGANQGGKSTFLRSVGLAQLMMQCGMFVPADSFRSSVCAGVWTHYKREEDPSMKSGKLDEELSRMSEIADRIQKESMVLFNESFAATNEREGSEIAQQIIRALLGNEVKVLFVTHSYELAHNAYKGVFAGITPQNSIYLRAERRPDGVRTFRLTEGEPLQTSFGEDLYHQIFEEDSANVAADSGSEASIVE